MAPCLAGGLACRFSLLRVFDGQWRVQPQPPERCAHLQDSSDGAGSGGSSSHCCLISLEQVSPVFSQGSSGRPGQPTVPSPGSHPLVAPSMPPWLLMPCAGAAAGGVPAAAAGRGAEAAGLPAAAGHLPGHAAGGGAHQPRQAHAVAGPAAAVAAAMSVHACSLAGPPAPQSACSSPGLHTCCFVYGIYTAICTEIVVVADTVREMYTAGSISEAHHAAREQAGRRRRYQMS